MLSSVLIGIQVGTSSSMLSSVLIVSRLVLLALYDLLSLFMAVPFGKGCNGIGRLLMWWVGDSWKVQLN